MVSIDDLKDREYLDDEEFEKYKDLLKAQCAIRDGDENSKETQEDINRMFLPFTVPQEKKYKGFEDCPRCPAFVKIPLKGETWERHEGTGLLVSNLGRVAETKNNTPTPYEILNQYEKYSMYTGFLAVKGKLVYRLVAETFKRMSSYQGYVCHHIDNNGTHNTLDNLIWLTKAQHREVYKK